MTAGYERISRITDALGRAQLDAVVCALPAYVLMTTGYWPVVGTSIAVCTREGQCCVLAPEDERDLAQRGWAEVHRYQPSSLDELRSAAEAVRPPLQKLMRELGVTSGSV